MTIVKAAAKLGIKSSTAKLIVKRHRETGSFFESKENRAKRLQKEAAVPSNGSRVQTAESPAENIGRGPFATIDTNFTTSISSNTTFLSFSPDMAFSCYPWPLSMWGYPTYIWSDLFYFLQDSVLFHVFISPNFANAGVIIMRFVRLSYIAKIFQESFYFWLYKKMQGGLSFPLLGLNHPITEFMKSKSPCTFFSCLCRSLRKKITNFYKKYLFAQVRTFMN